MFIKKALASVICVILVICSSFINVSAQEIVTSRITSEEYKVYRMYMPSLMSVDENNIDLEALRKRLFDGFYNGTKIINISDFGIKDISVVAELLWYNMPELLKMVGQFAYSYVKDTGLILGISYIYRDNIPENYKTLLDDFEKEADNMTSGLKTDKLSDVQKALILHDRIIAKCEYDTVAAEELEYFYKINKENKNAVPPWDAAFTAYGAIVEGSAICQGYTEAYEYLLKKVGIESVRCESNLLNHIWNILFINGKSYHVDVTWDDPVALVDENGNIVPKSLDYIGHNNFLLSSEAIFQNGHNLIKEGYTEPDYNFTPNDETYDNYFWKNCHHETFLIGDGLYHYNDDNALCEYDTTIPLADSGIGDIDGDKRINSVDISYCRQYVMGARSFTDNQFTACDITKDGQIGLTDLVRIKKILLYIK